MEYWQEILKKEQAMEQAILPLNKAKLSNSNNDSTKKCLTNNVIGFQKMQWRSGICTTVGRTTKFHQEPLPDQQ